MMDRLSALGDSALLIPASLALLAFLAVGRRSLATAFAAGLAVCGLATLAAKIAFHACGSEISRLEIVSPSGHASFATLVYGSVALMVATGRPASQAWPIALAAFALLAGIGVSRVATGAHSVEEVAVGWALGAASLALVATLHARAGRPRLSPWPVAIGLAAALVLVGGREFTPEAWIAGAARRVGAMVDVCAGTPDRHAELRSGRSRP